MGHGCGGCGHFLLILLVLAVASIALSIKCWVCRSNVDPKCADPFDNSSLPIQDCNEYFLDHLKAYENGSDRGGAYNTLMEQYYTRFGADYNNASGGQSNLNPFSSLGNPKVPVTDNNPYGRLRQYGVPNSQDRSGKGLAKATMCRKIRQKVHGEWRTIRSCAFLGEPGEGTGNEHHCLVTRGSWDIYMEYCTCNSKDGCNPAASLHHSAITYASLVSLPSVILISFATMLSTRLS